MPRVKFDHVSFLVRNLDETVKDYAQMLAVLDPEQAKNIVWDEGVEGGYKMRWATFVNPNGASLQFFESDNPYDQKLLEKHGERVHHLAFTSDDLQQDGGRSRQGRCSADQQGSYRTNTSALAEVDLCSSEEGSRRADRSGHALQGGQR